MTLLQNLRAALGHAFNQPIFLLVVCGSLLGANFPLGKIGAAQGFSPLQWAAVVSLGAVFSLFWVLLFTGRLSLPKRHQLRFIVIAALLSFLVPNLLLFTVIPKTGAGFSGLMFALTPVLTTAFSALLGFERVSRLGLVALGFGLAGAVTVAVLRSQGLQAPPLIWQAAALAIPLVLAAGNVYRGWDWPAGAQPDFLVFWSQILTLQAFGLLALFDGTTLPWAAMASRPSPALLQGAVAGLLFPLVFRLQVLGGAILLSQIGYVAAGVGLVLATVVLGEHYPAPIWLGAAIIALGLALTTYDRLRASASDQQTVAHGPRQLVAVCKT